MSEWHVVSFSGGKDSTAMLLHMLELGMHVDEIIFCDTGVEFPAMYEHLDKVERYIGRKITRLHAEKSFEHMLLEHEYQKRATGETVKGNSWCTPRNRWCTGYFKRDTTKRHLKDKENVVLYIGIAADEQKRIKDKRYPLVEWGWTEKDALAYCYSKGFDWGGLYKIFNRVSCWCCPLARLGEYRRLRKHFPQLWQKLLLWDSQVSHHHFLKDYTAAELDARFAREEEAEAMKMSLF